MLDGSSATRASLLRRARDKDSRAWTELVELYEPLIASWCRRSGLDSHRVADCVQEVLASVAVSLQRFEPTRTSGSFRAWLWTIAQNKVRDCVRREAKQAQPDGGSNAMHDLGQVVDGVPMESEPTEDADVNELIARAMNQIRDEFAPRTWRIFDRTVVDGITTSQVAEEFDVSPATVRQTRSRILRRLRQQLGDLT